MAPSFTTLAAIVIIGASATAVMDLWALFQTRILGIPSLNMAMVGRWIGGMRRGRFTHTDIRQSTPVPRETAIGWAAHYLIGISFAAMLVLFAGPSWIAAPTVIPALTIGWITLAAPFLIMQPAFGFGVAASRTPTPSLVRLLSFAAHGIFGVGLYLGGWVWLMIEVRTG